jgi:hypothetical protein
LRRLAYQGILVRLPTGRVHLRDRVGITTIEREKDMRIELRHQCPSTVHCALALLFGGRVRGLPAGGGRTTHARSATAGRVGEKMEGV